MSMIMIDVANEQTLVPIDRSRIKAAVRMILQEEAIGQGEISVAVVDDAAIQNLNRRYLNHDYPTDVLSFLLDRRGDRLEGEVIVSAQTARSSAGEYGLSVDAELLLYVIHGVLHLLGHDDVTPPERAKMQERQLAYLARLGFQPRGEEPLLPERPADTVRGADPRSGGKEIP